MRRVFADTQYWVANANPRDQWHAAVIELESYFADAQIVTTEEVLVEVLAALSGAGRYRRVQASAMVRTILAEDTVLVVAQSHESFADGLELYEARSDKEYSLTDCISMNVCRSQGIIEVLSGDRHFSQEGFATLIGPAS
jgi:uncharacterized protein